MEYGIYDILKLVGALGFFIYGMKVMSESIQKVAGDSLRSVMSIITSNRVSGVFTGFLTTAIIQSSSATTVMVVSFVNAGLLKLRQAIGVIMGANIGTTITAVLILVFGFSKFSISHYTLPIIAVGFPMLFAKKVELKYWGEFLIGFALLFMGLSALKGAVPDLKHNPEILAWITDLNNLGFLSVVIAVLIGTILTVVVQSSSAAMAITLIMCDNGWIPYDMAAGIVLGENIGTTITANLAALVGNVHAKRAALAHFMFNVFGVVWMLLIFNFYINGIDSIMVSTGNGSPLNETGAIKWGLTYFHISFNILNTAIMIWFVPQIESVVTKLISSKDEEDEEFHLEFIGTQLMRTAELSLMEARKEVAKFSKHVVKMSKFVQELIESSDSKRIERLTEKISKYEDRTDELEMEIDDYLVKVSEGRLSTAASEEIRAIMSVTSDLERTADIFMRMSREINRKNKHSLTFTEGQVESIKKIFGLVDDALAVMHANLKADYSEVELEEAMSKETAINKLKKELSKQHWKSVEENHYDVQTGIVYRDIIFGCERIGDHIINVTESIVGIEEHVSLS
ncbi:MAG: Na/Pi cotransporter family protein [Reichenbachiella sp.]|uniref:Na/Pi cotransporter family protein n=1 Tax=Reichenbachiella sp. TaxID=2184521 RepID=UPI002966B196|nr:Na/Pi cotransporter family protein [Reichenbachiella sp.]MDW3210458.1 Na/Pi cotransporter family protein [Reichenbachiella sp.]